MKPKRVKAVTAAAEMQHNLKQFIRGTNSWIDQAKYQSEVKFLYFTHEGKMRKNTDAKLSLAEAQRTSVLLRDLLHVMNEEIRERRAAARKWNEEQKQLQQASFYKSDTPAIALA